MGVEKALAGGHNSTASVHVWWHTHMRGRERINSTEINCFEKKNGRDLKMHQKP